jgi:hypothetical protein
MKKGGYQYATIAYGRVHHRFDEGNLLASVMFADFDLSPLQTQEGQGKGH